eukprot:763199-Hanusia_phi.AAC.2
MSSGCLCNTTHPIIYCEPHNRLPTCFPGPPHLHLLSSEVSRTTPSTHGRTPPSAGSFQKVDVTDHEDMPVQSLQGVG